MEKIRIGFSYHANNLLSSAIKRVESSPYSHVYIRRNSKYGEYIYQASGIAVNFMNIDIFLKNNVIVEEYEFEFAEEEKDKLIKFFIKYAGTKYGLSSIFKIFAILACKRIGISKSFKGDSDQSFICSELGALFCEEILKIEIPEDSDFITPKMLNPIVASHGVRTI